jgi:hypothetical protein
MQESIFDEIINEFKEAFKSRDYLIEAKGYKDYYTLKGERDKRRKYFNIGIALKSLRKFDTAENTHIMGEAFTKASGIMKKIEDAYEDVTFSGCSYNGKGIVEINFCTISEVALRELTSDNKAFNVERW